MIFLKRLAGLFLTALFCVAFTIEVMLYTLRWVFVGRTPPAELKSVKPYQNIFNLFINL